MRVARGAAERALSRFGRSSLALCIGGGVTSGQSSVDSELYQVVVRFTSDLASSPRVNEASGSQL